MINIETILRIERAKSGMTIDEMCDLAKISRPNYYRMQRNGFDSLKARDLISLADLFGVSTDYLLGVEKEVKS